MQSLIKIHEADNVAVALKDLKKGECVSIGDKEEKLVVLDDITSGHKVALCRMEAGCHVIKYGFPIGSTKQAVEAGSHIHTHNLKTNLSDVLEYEYHPKQKTAQMACEKSVEEIGEEAYFMGYERADNRAGVRNELWIIPTVGCVNSIAKMLAEQSQPFLGENVDGVVALTHPYGCSQMGEDQENTRKALAALVHHPNAGGVLVLGLGCENCNIEVLKEYIGDYEPDRVRFLQCQDVEDEIEEGLGMLKELADYASKCKRTKVSMQKLVVGLKCGGSDGFSGITANPTVGQFSDIVVAAGGSTILTEVPEMFGAETILMERAQSREVFDKTVSLINDFKAYFQSHNQTIYENPSPGNKAGGISTLEDKALGCTQKSGSAPVVDVLAYGEKLQKSGLNLLYAPGNDLVASTALALSGAQIILFTTGRGTPFAGVVPTVKISTNTKLAEKKAAWIDFDCGRLINQGLGIEALGKELYEYVLAVAGGEKVKSEKSDYKELAIWKGGVTL